MFEGLDPDTSKSEAFAAAAERRIPGGGSLDSEAWSLKPETRSLKPGASFHHRDSVGRIEILTDAESALDTDITVEVYEPLDEDDPVRLDPDDVDDGIMRTPHTFEMLGEAVWYAEYFARQIAKRHG